MKTKDITDQPNAWFTIAPNAQARASVVWIPSTLWAVRFKSMGGGMKVLDDREPMSGVGWNPEHDRTVPDDIAEMKRERLGRELVDLRPWVDIWNSPVSMLHVTKDHEDFRCGIASRSVRARIGSDAELRAWIENHADERDQFMKKYRETEAAEDEARSRIPRELVEAFGFDPDNGRRKTAHTTPWQEIAAVYESTKGT